MRTNFHVSCVSPILTALVGIFVAGCGGAGDEPAAGDNGRAKQPEARTARDAGTGSGSTTGGTTGGASGASGSATAIDYSRFTGWQSLHPAGDKAYHSGFDGTNTYVVPMVFFAAAPPTVTFSDGTVAEQNGPVLTVSRSLLPNLPEALEGKIQLVFVKTKKAGQTTVTGTSGSLTQPVTLKVEQYTPQDVTLGEQRYNSGTPSCNSCHAQKSVHNPGALADLSDEVILGIAVDGNPIERVNLETTEVETVKPNNGNHKWQVTTAERKGLMAYLRSRSLTFQLPGGIGGTP
jgi:hypothetical protein